MRTTETPFLTFWRALDAELFALGQSPATQGEAVPAYQCATYDHGPASGAADIIRLRAIRESTP